MATVGYLYGDSGQLLMMKDGADWKGFEPDGLASTGRVIRDDGLTQNTYRYDAYGNVLSKTSVVQNNWQWGSRPGTYTLPVGNGFPVTSFGSWGWIPTIVLTGSGIRVGPRPGYGTDDYWRIINKNLRNWPPIFATEVSTSVVPGAVPRRGPPKTNTWVPPVPPVNTPSNVQPDRRPPIPYRNPQGILNDLSLAVCVVCCAGHLYPCTAVATDCTNFKIEFPQFPDALGDFRADISDATMDQIEEELYRRGQRVNREKIRKRFRQILTNYADIRDLLDKFFNRAEFVKCLAECAIDYAIRTQDLTDDFHDWQNCNQYEDPDDCQTCCKRLAKGTHGPHCYVGCEY